MLKNKKGFTLIELILLLTIICLISLLSFSMYIFGIQTFNSSNSYLNQQDHVVEVVQKIRKDLLEASSIKVSADLKTLQVVEAASGTNKYWKFDSDTLKFSLDGVSFSTVVEGINTSGTNSYFKIDQKKLLLKIQPDTSNFVYNQNRNITEPINTEFSVRYKDILP